jgi:formylglycine-generating enzyme required for sulfatase activity
MGSATGDSDEKPAHRVALTRDFELGKYEVTQAQWAQVMGTRPSYSSA